MAIDLQDLQKVSALVPELPDSFRDVDVLVNNAGTVLQFNQHCPCHCR